VEDKAMTHPSDLTKLDRRNSMWTLVIGYRQGNVIRIPCFDEEDATNSLQAIKDRVSEYAMKDEKSRGRDKYVLVAQRNAVISAEDLQYAYIEHSES
jgi:hypothetical protein